MSQLRVNSLFSGGGTFDHGVHLAGGVTVSQCEYDAHAQAVLRHRFPHVPLHGDIRTLRGADLPDAELVMFGSPCQDLSNAGLKQGIGLASLDEYLAARAQVDTLRADGTPDALTRADAIDATLTRSGLYWEAIRVIKEQREATHGRYPTLALWENVTGAFTSNGGRDFAIVLGGFLHLGARDVSWRTLDSQFFGVPQRRRRIFLVADFGGERARDVLFEPQGMRRHPAPRREPGTIVAALTAHGVGASGPDDNQAQAGHLIPIPARGEALRECLTTGSGRRYDLDTESFVLAPTLGTTTGLASTLTRMSNGAGTGYGSPRGDGSDNLVVHPLGFDCKASNVQVIPDQSVTLRAMSTANPDTNVSGGGHAAVAFHITQTPISSEEITPCLTAGSTDGQATLGVAVAINQNGSDVQVSDLAGCLTTGVARGTSGPLIAAPAYAVRRLTPVECERLQALPDGWTAVPWKRGVLPDSARYKICGNGGTATVIAWIIRRAAQALNLDQHQEVPA